MFAIVLNYLERTVVFTSVYTRKKVVPNNTALLYRNNIVNMENILVFTVLKSFKTGVREVDSSAMFKHFVNYAQS